MLCKPKDSLNPWITLWGRVKLAQALSVVSVLAASHATYPAGIGTGEQSPNVAPRRLALLVGVGDYYQNRPGPGHKPWPKLHTKEEIEQYRQVLIRDYGFLPNDVLVLQDQTATSAQIRETFRKHLIAQARPGDIVVFHFSGHGQHLPDDAARPDEPDGLDESLVTYDALDQSWQEGSAKNIRDDEVGDLLEELAAKMRPAPTSQVVGNITVTLDACYSGSATRGLLIPRGRAWDTSTDGPPPRPLVRIDAAGRDGFLSSQRESLRDITVVAAARADQSAWERDRQGVFTKHWVRLLARPNRERTISYQDAVNRLAIEIAASGVDQEPVVEGAASRPLLSALPTTAGQTGTVRALRGGDGALWLQQGEVHGVTKDSVYALYDPDMVTPLGDAKVVQVTSFSAQLEPLPGFQLKGKPGAVAVETHHSYDLHPLRVVLRGFEKQSALRERIKQMDVARVVEEIPHTKAKGSKDFDLLLEAATDQRSVSFFGPTGATAFRKLALSENEPSAIEQQLQKQWRHLHFSMLHHENPALNVYAELFAVDVKLGPNLQILTAPTPKLIPVPAAHLALPCKSVVGLRLHNQSAKDLFVSVIALSPDGDIALWDAKQPGKNLIRSGSSRDSHAHQLITGQVGDRVLLKVIATEQFVDFSGISSNGEVRGGTAALPCHPSYVPLQTLINGIGQNTRGARPGPIQTNWGTSDASITILPSP